MTFEELLDQAMAMLQRRGRVTYQTLRLQFQLDEEHLEAQPFQGIYRIRFAWPRFSQWRRDHRFCKPFVALVSSWDRADVSCTVAG